MTDPRVDAYIESAAAFAQPLLRQWRAWMRHPQVEEAIKWGMPHFVYKGKLLGAMAAFKSHCAFGFWAGEVAQRGDSKAMGQFGRVSAKAEMPKAAEVKALLKAALAAIDAGTPARERGARKTPPTPEALRLALAAQPKAAAFFAQLPPSSPARLQRMDRRGQAGNHPRAPHRPGHRVAGRGQAPALEVREVLRS